MHPSGLLPRPVARNAHQEGKARETGKVQGLLKLRSVTAILLRRRLVSRATTVWGPSRVAYQLAEPSRVSAEASPWSLQQCQDSQASERNVVIEPSLLNASVGDLSMTVELAGEGVERPLCLKEPPQDPSIGLRTLGQSRIRKLEMFPRSDRDFLARLTMPLKPVTEYTTEPLAML